MLFKLQNVDVVSELEAQAKISAPRNITAKDKTRGPEFLLVPKDIPPSMAFIYRNTQSWTNIDALPPVLRTSPINKKSQNLLDYANAGSVQVDDKKAPPNLDGTFKQKKSHQSIEKVKGKMSDYTNAYIATHPDRSSIMANRTGMNYITQDTAGRQRLNDAQTSQFSDEQKMAALSGEFVKNNAIQERKGFFSKFKPETKVESNVKLAQKIITETTQNVTTPKTRKDFGKILPSEKAKLDSKLNSSSSAPPTLTSAFNAAKASTKNTKASVPEGKDNESAVSIRHKK